LDSDRRAADHGTINQVANVSLRSSVDRGQLAAGLRHESFDIGGRNAKDRSCCEESSEESLPKRLDKAYRQRNLVLCYTDSAAHNCPRIVGFFADLACALKARVLA
jgi:hypothetical protein